MNKDLKTAIEALENIASPILYLQKEAIKDGGSFNGHMAIEITKNAHFYRELAEKALMKIKNTQP